MSTITLTQISNGDSGDATVVDNNFDTIANEINGNLDATNLDPAAAIALSQLAAVAWTSYTPTLGNVTTGNGTLSGAYTRIGRFIAGRISFVFGSTSSFGGVITATLPVAANAAYVRYSVIGTVGILDVSVNGCNGAVEMDSATDTVVFSQPATTPAAYQRVDATHPMTWATGDKLLAEFFYEAVS